MSCYIQDCIDFYRINILNYIGFIQELYYRIIGIYRDIYICIILYIYILPYLLFDESCLGPPKKNTSSTSFRLSVAHQAERVERAVPPKWGSKSC